MSKSSRTTESSISIRFKFPSSQFSPTTKRDPLNGVSGTGEGGGEGGFGSPPASLHANGSRCGQNTTTPSQSPTRLSQARCQSSRLQWLILHPQLRSFKSLRSTSDLCESLNLVLPKSHIILSLKDEKIITRIRGYEKGKFDELVEDKGVKIVIDPKALMHVIGTKMDFVDDKLRSEFVFINPNSKGQCGCGESFMT
ncbi:unnamed protein product [Lactuca virosa]|uniref:Core domain-containing protein n=1 Tax=Lactuca virosa TaxID=75947 RepID=A0AAU9PRD3_9ASTR|nr:unnamed protein product [Lactuca virosa]